MAMEVASKPYKSDRIRGIVAEYMLYWYLHARYSSLQLFHYKMIIKQHIYLLMNTHTNNYLFYLGAILGAITADALCLGKLHLYMYICELYIYIYTDMII